MWAKAVPAVNSELKMKSIKIKSIQTKDKHALHCPSGFCVADVTPAICASRLVSADGTASEIAVAIMFTIKILNCMIEN